LAACSATSTASTPTPTVEATRITANTQSATDVPLPTQTALPTATNTPLPPGIIGPDSYPENVDPLTGLVVDDPSVLNRRPLLVKISNAPPVVRPQSGISIADVIFEEYAEGGWTRFTAVFYSHGGQHIGSVRSVRLIDLQLTPAFDGVLVFSGGSLGVIDTLRE